MLNSDLAQGFWTAILTPRDLSGMNGRARIEGWDEVNLNLDLMIRQAPPPPVPLILRGHQAVRANLLVKCAPASSGRSLTEGSIALFASSEVIK
jgi:hypothetical protein